MKDVRQSIASEPALCLLLLLICSIFGAELFSHWIIHTAAPVSLWLESLGDSALLSTLIIPSVYFFMFLPLKRHISESKQAEKALRESEEHYRALFSHAMDGIMLIDTEGNVANVNDSFAHMHGYSTDEFLKMNLRDLDTPEALAQAPERYARLLAGESIKFEVQHFHKDGHILPLEVASSPIEINGKPFVLGFHRDITERRRAELEIRRSHQELRELSKAANEALEIERRQTARELHDELGQSLTALKMDVKWILDKLPEGQKTVTEKLDKMQKILKDMTAATRRIASNLRPLILDDLGLVPAAEWLVENFMEHNGVNCELVIADPCLDLAEPHATAIFRILQESLTNIAKHAQASHVGISIREVNGEVRLTVRDNGSGFIITDPRKPGSYGLLGLRERAHLAGGRVHIDSAPGRGTLIDVHIPVAQSRPKYQDYSI